MNAGVGAHSVVRNSGPYRNRRTYGAGGPYGIDGPTESADCRAGDYLPPRRRLLLENARTWSAYSAGGLE